MLRKNASPATTRPRATSLGSTASRGSCRYSVARLQSGNENLGGAIQSRSRYMAFPAFLFRAKNMREARLFLVVLLTMLAVAPPASARPVPVIFDTDIGNDVDDALALAMLHALESRGEARLLAVTITKDNKWAAPFVNLVNTFYGRPAIPIGVVKA